MDLNIKYPAVAREKKPPRQPVDFKPNDLQKVMNIPSRWRERTTDEEIGRAILTQGKHHKEQLEQFGLL